MTAPEPELEAVLDPLRRYADGHATGDARHFRAAFLPTAHVEGLRNMEFVSWDLETYCGGFGGEPAASEADHRRTVDAVQVHGTVATATMTLDHGESIFTDMFVLVRVSHGWRIANKVFHRQQGSR